MAAEPEPEGPVRDDIEALPPRRAAHRAGHTECWHARSAGARCPFDPAVRVETIMILLRTTTFSPRTAAFARQLELASGQPLAVVVDERRGAVAVAGFEKIGLTRASCRAAGLHCPLDVGWRCGDYGFYLARRRFPAERHFWLFEHDVRISGTDASVFFRNFDGAAETDLIAGYYQQAGRDWYWTHTMAARGRSVWRCLFPVVRLSAPAIDLLHAERRAYAGRLLRLANWPNDESFVATVLTHAGRRCADLNDFGATVYDESTYTFARPLNGDDLLARLDEPTDAPMLFHPVLFGADLQKKIETMAWIDKGESLPRKVKRRLIDALSTRLAA